MRRAGPCLRRRQLVSRGDAKVGGLLARLWRQEALAHQTLDPLPLALCLRVILGSVPDPLQRFAVHRPRRGHSCPDLFLLLRAQRQWRQFGDDLSGFDKVPFAQPDAHQSAADRRRNDKALFASGFALLADRDLQRTAYGLNGVDRQRRGLQQIGGSSDQSDSGKDDGGGAAREAHGVLLPRLQHRDQVKVPEALQDEEPRHERGARGGHHGKDKRDPLQHKRNPEGITVEYWHQQCAETIAYGDAEGQCRSRQQRLFADQNGCHLAKGEAQDAQACQFIATL
ncbi:hypothetical protein D3C86_1303570 [compost metagenome]